MHDRHPDGEFADQNVFVTRSAAMAPTLAEDDLDIVGPSHLDVSAEQRHDLRQVWHRWFEHHTCSVRFWVRPRSPTTTRTIMDRTVEIDGASRPHRAHLWLGFIGVLGLPSVVVPIGRTAAGLPVGMQIVAPWYHDYRAIRAAELMTDVLGGYESPPGF
jgi:amidase